MKSAFGFVTMTIGIYLTGSTWHLIDAAIAIVRLEDAWC